MDKLLIETREIADQILSLNIGITWVEAFNIAAKIQQTKILSEKLEKLMVVCNCIVDAIVATD